MAFSFPPGAGFAFDLRDVEWCDFTAFDFIEADPNFPAQLSVADSRYVVGLAQPCGQFTALLRREGRRCGLNFVKRADGFEFSKVLGLRKPKQDRGVPA